MPPLEFTLSKKFKAKQVGAKIKEAAADDKARHRYGTMRIEVLSDLKKDFCQLSHCSIFLKKHPAFNLQFRSWEVSGSQMSCLLLPLWQNMADHQAKDSLKKHHKKMRIRGMIFSSLVDSGAPQTSKLFTPPSQDRKHHQHQNKCLSISASNMLV